MSIGTQNLCRLHYVAFYVVFFSLCFNFGVKKSDTLAAFFTPHGDSDHGNGTGHCPFTTLIGLLFFCLANAFAAAGRLDAKGQRVMIQYVGMPLQLAIFYLNRELIVSTAQNPTALGVDFVQNHVVFVAATLFFVLSTHTLYIA